MVLLVGFVKVFGGGWNVLEMVCENGDMVVLVFLLVFGVVVFVVIVLLVVVLFV